MSYDSRRIRRSGLAALGTAAIALFLFTTVASGREQGLGGVEHFACYTVNLDGFDETEFEFSNQFGRGRGTITAPDILCAPARKNTESIQNRKSHLMCYQLRFDGEFEKLRVSIKNQWGSDQRFTVLDPRTMCLPAAKSRLKMPSSPATTPSHFTCFAIEPLKPFKTQTITMADQFEKTKGTAYRAARLCAPTQKNDSKILNSRVHLLCYLFKSATKVHPKIFVRDQFEKLTGTLGGRMQFCVPSLKKVLRS